MVFNTDFHMFDYVIRIFPRYKMIPCFILSYEIITYFTFLCQKFERFLFRDFPIKLRFAPLCEPTQRHPCRSCSGRHRCSQLLLHTSRQTRFSQRSNVTQNVQAGLGYFRNIPQSILVLSSNYLVLNSENSGIF